MRKICVLLALLLVFGVFPSACAETHTYSTEKPDAFQFCELYVKRVIELENEVGIDLNTSTIGMGFLNLGIGIGDNDLLYANCSGGKIGFDPDDYSVQCWDDVLFYMDDDVDTKLTRMLKVAVAISALEYESGPDEMWMKYFENMTPFMKVYTEILSPLYDDIDVTIRKIKAQKKRRLFFQGKYDYYIDCWETSDGRDMVVIYAE